MQFNLDGQRNETIQHSYLRSIWALLVILAACSFVAQRSWSSIFDNETLRAILKLPGYEELSLVMKVQELSPCNTLRSSKKAGKTAESNLLAIAREDLLIEEDLMGEANEYNHMLDHYSDQLTYLLLPTRTSAYKLAGINLRARLLRHTVISFCLTGAQFIIPRLSIGPGYTLYGWHYLGALLGYSFGQLAGSGENVNSIDYDISGRLWPVETQCEYKQFGLQGVERHTVICTSPMNEISGKIFALIWWLVLLNIAFELYTLCWTLASSLDFRTARYLLGRRCWPHARSGADYLASFRYLRASRRQHAVKPATKLGQSGQLARAASAIELNTDDRKRIKAEEARGLVLGSSPDQAQRVVVPKRWCRGLLVAASKTAPDSDGFCELKEDVNLYFLLYLIYLRLESSSRKIEHVITVTQQALEAHIERMGSEHGSA